jgi:hypothetical protein
MRAAAERDNMRGRASTIRTLEAAPAGHISRQESRRQESCHVGDRRWSVSRHGYISNRCNRQRVQKGRSLNRTCTKRYIRHRLSGGEGSKPIYTIQTIVADNMQHFRPVRPSHRVRRAQSYTALHLLVILPRCLRVHRLIWCSLVAEAF